MGNVQSEATQESETAKDGEEKANPDGSKPDRGPSSTKHELRSRSPSLQAPEQKAASQPLSSEPGGGDRSAGAAEMGKNHSKKSKLKLSSMWAQNSACGGTKEASLCDKDLGTEKRGLACVGRVDLQSSQSSGSVLQEESKGLKGALRPPQAAASDPRDLSTKRAPTKGKGKPENVHLAKNAGGLLLQQQQQTEKLVELGPATDTHKDVVETEVCWTQHIKASAKEYLDNEGRLPESRLSGKKQPASSAHGVEPSKMPEDMSAGPRCLNEKNGSRPVPSSCMAPPGGKKALLSWGSGQKEKKRAGQRDSAPGSDGDSRGPSFASQLPVELAKTPGSPVEKPQDSGSDAKAGVKSEALGAEGVSSETMQELLEKGLNFLYKVTIQPGQWPPSIKAVKQKAGVISSGISYADVLKQCPQKKSPAAGAPVLPKALHHLNTAGKKLLSFKGLDRSNPEDFSSLSQLFLEHFKKVTPKEPAPRAPNQQVVTFFEELSAGNTTRPEWQRPRPPTPYPQRRKGQGRKLPKFGTAVSQVVAFLGSDPKCDWRDDSQISLDEATATAEEGGKDCADPPSPSDKGAEAMASSQPVATTLLMEQEMTTEVDEAPQRSRRRLQDLEGDATKSVPYNAVQSILCPLADTPSLHREDQPPVALLSSRPHSPRELLEVPSPAISAPCAPVRLIPDQKVPAVTQARPKIRKQGPSAPKSKEKLKPSGQSKVKAPKGKGQKQWPRGYGMTSPLRLEGVPLFPPFEKVARPFYFGESLEAPLSLEKPASIDQDATSAQAGPDQDREADQSPAHHQWPAFQVADSCSRKCYCKHQDQRKLPKNVVAWLNPSSNHLTEPPWVATAMLAVSLVAGAKFCLDSYEQQRIANED
ncbi:gametogenetin [Rhineura floridana]|uniref:gametogenetin n=1 Tax=Rhineura floridana TaxID=261503 RepID=UPI002AC843C5|nr:gametogenetin [Rhineura floridana]